MPAPVRSPVPAIAVTYRGTGTEPDAILSYSEMLTGALNQTGRVRGTLIAGDAGGGWNGAGANGSKGLLQAVADFDAVLLQYNPFSYGRWGVAPWLLRDLSRLRRRGRTIALMVHEAYVAPVNRRQRLVRAYQKAQLRALLKLAEVTFTASEANAGLIRALDPAAELHLAPVGSNLPDRRRAREASRARCDVHDDDLVLVAFGTGHPSQLVSWVGRAAAACSGAGRGPVVFNLGAGAHPIEDAIPGVRVVTPGPLPAAELSEMLAAGDVFVAPFLDGVSTRRTTVMAALQHELPVVTTRSDATDRLLSDRPDALKLVNSADLQGFESAVQQLAADPSERARQGRCGRRLYEAHFDWPVIANRFAERLGGSAGGVSADPVDRPVLR